MKSLKEQLVLLEERFCNLSKRLEKIRDCDLEGCLTFNKRNNSTQYYHCYNQDGKRVRKYLSENDRSIARALARKAYLFNVRSTVQKVSKLVADLNKIYEDLIIEKLYTDLPEERKALFSPIEPTFDQILTQWMSKPYTSNPYPKGDYVILTNNGEQVRSKSEKIMADHFRSKNICYKYEKLLILEGKEIYPDFTFLHPITRQEIYWEHFGIMDYEDYAAQAYEKISLYERNGLMLGDRLIVTFESRSQNFDYKLLDAKIEMGLG